MTDTPALIAGYTPQFFLNTWITTWAAQIGVEPNLQPGNCALGVGEATVSQVTVLQFLTAAVAAFARAQTSTGADLDSFFAQFGFTRNPASAAKGTVVFSSAVAVTRQVLIPVGTVVQTQGGLITYSVIADNSNPSYSPTDQAYIMQIGQSSVNVTVQANQAGTGFNVQAKQLTQTLTTITSITSVNNPTAIIDGENEESDAAFRLRFVAWLNSLAKGTYLALLLALEDIAGLTKIGLYENVQAINNPPTKFIPYYYGNIVAIVDDGSGAPGSSLLNAAWNAINNTRAWPAQFQVLPPEVVQIILSMTLRIDGNADETTVLNNVRAALITFIEGINIGQIVYAFQLEEVAKNADPAVISVQPGSTKINSIADDLTLQPWQEAIVIAGHISLGTY